MSVDIDLADANVWDDSALVKSWNSALQEYKKYHSIHAKGQKLADVLTKEELDMLVSNGLEVDGTQNDIVEDEVEEDDYHGDAPMVESDVDYSEQQTDTKHENKQSQDKTIINAADHVPQAPPQLLMNSVKDENIRNLMMSWYWAGYYTGFHEGQQNASAS